MIKFAFILLLGPVMLCSCGSNESAEANQTDEPVSTNKMDAGGEIVCNYPEFTSSAVEKGDFLAPLEMHQGFKEMNGAREDFSIKDFYCSKEYENYHSIVLVVLAEWCPACELMVNSVEMDHASMEANGSKLIYIVDSDVRSQSAETSLAQEYVTKYTDKGHGYRIGGVDITPWGNTMESIEYPLKLVNFPSGYIFRKSTMELVASSNTEGQDIDFAAITAEIKELSNQ